MAGVQATVARDALKNLQQDIIDLNTIDRNDYMRQSAKVFLMTFPEFDPTMTEPSDDNRIYFEKFSEYMTEMETLLGVPQPNDVILEGVLAEMAEEEIDIIVCVKRCEVPEGVDEPMLLVNVDSTQPNQLEIPLIEDSVETETLSFDAYKALRAENKSIGIRLEADVWPQELNEELHEFSASYLEFHCEGFNEWIEFGRGVRAQIVIGSAVSTTVNLSATDVSLFHIHIIHAMLERRLGAQRVQTSPGTGHKKVGRKAMVTYNQGNVTAKTEQAFWSMPVTDYKQDIKTIGEDIASVVLKGLSVRPTVRFCDIQIGYFFGDDFDDTVCLCSEWCNWNAFFYYNPVYRFLTVRHNHLYLDNNTNTADMYLLSTAVHAHRQQPIPYTPVLQLMTCANHYREIFYKRYYLLDQDFKDLYDTTDPSAWNMNGLVYNSLRYDINIVELCLQSDANPFADQCIENFLNYYNVFASLHSLVSKNDDFVRTGSKKLWFIEFDKMSRNVFKNYVKCAYDLLNVIQIIDYDYLFSKDMEYIRRLEQTPDEKTLQPIRDKEFSFANPLNIRVMTNGFLFSFLSIHKFLTKIQQKIPESYHRDSYYDVVNMYLRMDRDFNTWLSTTSPPPPPSPLPPQTPVPPQQPKVFDFSFEDNLLIENPLQNWNKAFVVFYTLKIYFIAFDVQSYAIETAVTYSRYYAGSAAIQSCRDFNFIFEYEFIEDKFRKTFPNELLLQVNDQITIRFNNFYLTYWGRAAHETAQWTDIRQNISSGFMEYLKLYFWWNHNGNNRLKFTAILAEFDASLEALYTRNELIFRTYILRSIHLLESMPENEFEYNYEVMDRLVFYLTKAVCFLIVCKTAKLVKCMHSLQTDYNMTHAISYSMAKPGWVILFRRLRTVEEQLKRLKTSYIAFNDEFNRISKTVLKTKRMIRNIFRELYRKLTREWNEELIKLFNTHVIDQYICRFLCMHLSVGLAFVVSFTDDYRYPSHLARKRYQALMNRTASMAPTAQHQRDFQFFRNVCLNYMKNENSIRTALPFMDSEWQTNLNNRFNGMIEMCNQLDEGVVHISLNAADQL